jgi:hypothetical protein
MLSKVGWEKNKFKHTFNNLNCYEILCLEKN